MMTVPMSAPTANVPQVDVAIEEYASRLRDLLETLALARTQLRDVSACQGVMRAALTNIGEVLSAQPPTEGTENGLNRLWWLLRSAEDAETGVATIMDAQVEALPRLIAQERVATNVLSALNATLHGAGAGAAASAPIEAPRRKTLLYAVTG